MNTETKTKHKRYDEAFKKSAVAHWLISGKSARQVAAELGINSAWTAAGDGVACRSPMLPRNNRILHVDGDSFFASCEVALDSKLEGRPVWVGGGRRGDGIVIAANRLAKKFA